MHVLCIAQDWQYSYQLNITDDLGLVVLPKDLTPGAAP